MAAIFPPMSSKAEKAEQKAALKQQKAEAKAAEKAERAAERAAEKAAAAELKAAQKAADLSAMPPPKSKKPRSASKKGAKGGFGDELASAHIEENLRVAGLSPPPPSGLSPVQLAAMLATQEGGMNGVEFSSLTDLLGASPPLVMSSGFSQGFTPAMVTPMENSMADGSMSDEHISPSQQISMLLEQEGIKGEPVDMTEASPFDFSGAMPPSGKSMAPPPSKSPARKRSRTVAGSPAAKSANGLGSAKGSRKKAGAAGADGEMACLPVIPARLSGEFGEVAGEQQRLSDGTILELFDSLAPDQQAAAAEAAALHEFGRGRAAAAPQPPPPTPTAPRCRAARPPR